jgi:hypothetical protein
MSHASKLHGPLRRLHCIIRQLHYYFFLQQAVELFIQTPLIPQSAQLADPPPQAAVTDGADVRVFGTVRHLRTL